WPGTLTPPGTLPRRHSASFARSSSFSWIRRSSSASTSSRNASTSSSSYPGLRRVVLNCLFRTSAGVNGIWVSLARLESVRRDGTRSAKRGHNLDQDQDHNEQHCEAQVQRHRTQPEWRDETAEVLERGI